MQGAPLALLAVLKQRGVAALRLAPSLCAAIKKLAVNEDICKELADEGAVASCMQVRTRNLPCPYTGIWHVLLAPNDMAVPVQVV